MLRGEPDSYFAGAEKQARATAEERGADHAVGAADDGERPEGSLVHVARMTAEDGRQIGGERLPVESVAGRGRLQVGFETERMDGYRAAAIDAVAGEQSRLQRDERSRLVRADSRAMSDARVGADAAWNVEGKNRNSGGVGIVDLAA
jgi:surface antigen